MGLNIKNEEVERLATEIARQTGETKTEAIRQALLERKKRLGLPSVEERIQQLTTELDRILAGRKFPPITKEERDALYE
jgi:antitoxin VapB